MNLYAYGSVSSSCNPDSDVSCGAQHAPSLEVIRFDERAPCWTAVLELRQLLAQTFGTETRSCCHAQPCHRLSTSSSKGRERTHGLKMQRNIAVRSSSNQRQLEHQRVGRKSRKPASFAASQGCLPAN